MVDNTTEVPPVAPVEPVPPVEPVAAPVTQQVVPASTDTTDNSNSTLVEYKEPLYKKIWRPLLAITYIAIVLFDFVIMPVVMESINSHESNNEKAVELALKFKDPSAQIQALKTFTTDRTWTPLTLMGGGLFHVAFGALLTGAAVTRGMERKEFASKGTLVK